MPSLRSVVPMSGIRIVKDEEVQARRVGYVVILLVLAPLVGLLARLVWAWFLLGWGLIG